MKKIFFILVPLLFSLQLNAATSPLAVAIVKPIEFPPDDYNVTGIRVSLLWGHHRSVYGFDFGVLGNITELDFAGIAFAAGFNMTRGEAHFVGGQFAGITNINTNKAHVVGVQFAGGVNFNQAESSVSGLQAALIGNLASYTKIYGVQIGLYNRALSIYGLQVGLINIAENVHGLQIGLINFNRTGVFAVSPVLNFGF